jgi:hypothetical protein
VISNGPMIFIVGNSRSGTTMTGRILGNHPDIFTFGELHFFEQLWSPKDKGTVLSDAEAIGLIARLLCTQREGYFSSWQLPKRHHDESKRTTSFFQGYRVTFM